jgi:hypothetical protein
MATKSKKIEVLCTVDQFAAIDKRAEENNMSRSEFGLFCMLNTKINAFIGTSTGIVQDVGFFVRAKENNLMPAVEADKAISKLIDKI